MLLAFFKSTTLALTGVAHLVGHHPTRWNVASSIPGEDTCLGWGFSPQLRGNWWCFSLISMLVSLSFSFPSPLSKNEWIKSLKNKNKWKHRSLDVPGEFWFWFCLYLLEDKYMLEINKINKEKSSFSYLNYETIDVRWT